ncbi:MAG: DUF302 domain-containing protein [Xanthobacteraceae bacterium]
MTANGLITLPSAHGVKDTVDRLAAEVTAKGLTIFARIDHAAGAKDVGLPLRPTDLLIFGNAAGGTPLMQVLQTAGIDLPLKALAWEDADGKCWLSYNDPAWIAQRHDTGNGDAALVSAVTARLAAAMSALAKAAIGA